MDSLHRNHVSSTHNLHMTRDFEGVIRLPSSILVTEDALGETFTGNVPLGHFSFIFPQLPADRTRLRFLESPLPLDGGFHKVMEADSWGRMGFTPTPNLPIILSSFVKSVFIKMRLEASQDVPFYDLASLFSSQLDDWYTVAVSWMELWTNQVLTPDRNQSQFSNATIREVGIAETRNTGWG